jgi:hypothetical protein
VDKLCNLNILLNNLLKNLNDINCIKISGLFATQFIPNVSNTCKVLSTYVVSFVRNEKEKLL